MSGLLLPPTINNYKLIKIIGKGAYAQVYKAINVSNGKEYAVKRIKAVFKCRIKAKSTLRELIYLKFLNHPNILKIHEIFKPATFSDFDDVFFVTDLMDSDLRTFIRSENSYSIENVKYFCYHIACALQYIHSSNIIHRDIKPSNILINSKMEIKVCDFGLSREFYGTDEMTHYMVTRNYRAPEIILENSYDQCVDIWSLGCILAEFVLRRPLFIANNSAEQLNCIYEFLGKPNDLDWITNPNSKDYVISRYLEDRPNIKCSFPERTNRDLLDLVDKILKWNPKNRIGLDEILSHNFFRQQRDATFEYKSTNIYRVRHDWDAIPAETYKEMIYERILRDNEGNELICGNEENNLC